MDVSHEITKPRTRTFDLVLSCFRVFVAVLVAAPQCAAAPQPLPADLSKVQLRVGFLRNGHYSIETIPLETYVSRVLAGEAARDSRPAALEALAITIRTFALANRNRHRADGFDLCDQTHCQVVRAATAATDRAATATSAQVLMHGQTLASIYYTASCGGRTELPSAVWPGADDPPYLPSRRDDACAGTPVWSADLPSRDLERALGRAGFRGDLRAMRVAGRNPSGRVARLRLDGMTPAEISGQDLRVAVGRTLGWLHIKSTAFELTTDGHGRGTIYRFKGHGSGHGVGLCVIGSAHLAAEGVDARAILARYFPGATITSPGPAFVAARRDPGGIGTSRPPPPAPSLSPELLLALPDGDEGERARITTIALAARDDLARTLGVASPKRVTIRFHATIDEYAGATSQPWFTSGALVGDELHLVPLTVLRERGVLERTIRHELVHILTAGVLSSRPLWVREGAAIHFAGERPVPGDGRTASIPKLQGGCPSDLELREPVSAGALANAYARARMCFERQIAGGRSWKDVK